MSETKPSFLSRDVFLQCGWEYHSDPDERSVYDSIDASLNRLISEKGEAERESDQVKVLIVLSKIAYMMLTNINIDNPFESKFENSDVRSAIIDDFTDAEITFFAEILDDIEEPYLKARLADLLWLRYALNKYDDKPKKYEYAKQAIAAYTFHEINAKTWFDNVDECWNRAIRLCLQIKDDKTKSKLTDRLFTAFNQDYPNDKLMTFWLAQSLDKLDLDADCRNSIAKKLLSIGKELTNADDLISARRYITLAAKKYKQNEEQQCWAYCLALSAENVEKEADGLFSCNYKAVVNYCYKQALKIYKQIPEQYHDKFDIKYQKSKVEEKIAKTWLAVVDGMKMPQCIEIDISQMVKDSTEHVYGKKNLETALMFFALLDGEDSSQRSITELLKKNINAAAQKHPFSSSLFNDHYEKDGRCVAKTPGRNWAVDQNDSENQKNTSSKMHLKFSRMSELLTQSYILPALKQLKEEHEFTFSKVELLCKRSNFVPDDRAQLMTYGLLYGFQDNFAQAIYLLVPQFENCVRIQLTNIGAITIHTNDEGIESEKSLNGLMGLEQIEKVFDKDVIFEIKSIFTEPSTSNVRNNVAHGLWSDADSDSWSSIYAWWMILRLVVSTDDLPYKLPCQQDLLNLIDDAFVA